MDVINLPIIKKDERGVIHDCDIVKFIVRKKGTVSADHTHTVDEVLYLVKGKVELTIREETKNVRAPIKIVLPKGTYHKLVALTDIEILEDKNE